MRPSFRPVLALALLLTPIARAEPVSSTTQPVVYGTDDRVDWYAIPSPAMKTLARQSIVAIIPSDFIDLQGVGQLHPPFIDQTPTLDDYLEYSLGAPLCAGERFATQIVPGSCSGTLIADDLVLTAGHCARSLAECRQNLFVFDFLYESDGTLASIDADDVYECANVLVQSERSSPHLDYAIVQLDRPVVGRTPADVRTESTALTVGTPVTVIGFGTGLPLKYDDGGEVQDAHASARDVFVANTDTFAGNSGSGVFDAAGNVIGILVSGATDYVSEATCSRVNVLPNDQGNEDVTYVFRAVEALCDGGYPSGLCAANPAPTCGDDFCSGGETSASCPSDCTGLACGDGTCSGNETQANCPNDCTGARPRGSKGGCALATGAASPLPALSLVALLGLRWARRRRR